MKGREGKERLVYLSLLLVTFLHVSFLLSVYPSASTREVDEGLKGMARKGKEGKP